MTHYIVAYDTETPTCLAACRKIVEVHRRFDIRATFFIVGKILAADSVDYLELLDDSLFEVASHTYSHKMLLDHPFCGPAVSNEQIKDEILLGKNCVEHIFKRPCLGMRTGCGFTNGLKSHPEILQLVYDAGYKYISSMLWGLDFSMPAPLNRPFTYDKEGFPKLWEFPGHGWHDNLLKGNNKRVPLRILLFPSPMPNAIPNDYIRTPKEEFEFNNKPFIDKAIADKMLYISLIWHPWSLNIFDPKMKMLEITFKYVRKLDMPTGTFSDLLTRL